MFYIYIYMYEWKCVSRTLCCKIDALVGVLDTDHLFADALKTPQLRSAGTALHATRTRVPKCLGFGVGTDATYVHLASTIQYLYIYIYIYIYHTKQTSRVYTICFK
jgi:hypothetical protein